MKAGAHFAWLQLFKSKGHFAAAVAGVTFAVVLMFGQMGLRDSLLASSTRLYDHLDGQIVMTGWQYRSSQSPSSFANIRLAQARSVAGVASCSPVQLALVPFENLTDHVNHEIEMVGSDPDDHVFRFPEAAAAFDGLRHADALVFDAHSRDGFGPVVETFNQRGSVPVTVSAHNADVAGLVELGPGFVTDGTIFASDITFNTLAPSPQLALPALGIIRVVQGASVDEVLHALEQKLPSDVRFQTLAQFEDSEQNYWLTAEPIGVVFTSFLVLGVVVGAVVVYQILYSDVKNHLPEYATMKAMGFSQGTLFRVVMLQALYISILGFVPGTIIAEGIYLALAKATLLPFMMTVTKVLAVYGLTVMMCVVSAAIAMQALRHADPAEIF